MGKTVAGFFRCPYGYDLMGYLQLFAALVSKEEEFLGVDFQAWARRWVPCESIDKTEGYTNLKNPPVQFLMSDT